MKKLSLASYSLVLGLRTTITTFAALASAKIFLRDFLRRLTTLVGAFHPGRKKPNQLVMPPAPFVRGAQRKTIRMPSVRRRAQSRRSL